MAETVSLEDFIARADRITRVELGFDVEQARKAGLLREAADYTDAEFFRIVEGGMVRSNSEISTYAAGAFLGDKVANGKVGVVVKRRDGKFSYRYFGAYSYIGLFFSGRKFAKAVLYYTFYPKARRTVQQFIREHLWRHIPDFM
jgi:hypothetical protein